MAAALLEFEGSLGGTFEIFIQLGAVIAVFGFYARQIIEQVRRVGHDADVRRFWLGILIAVFPAAAIGVLLGNFIKDGLFDPVVVAVALIVGGIIFLVVERHLKDAPPAPTDAVTRITLRQALLIGIAQIAALIPGTSRSGASIIGAMLVGLDRRTATEFSFYLAMPTLGGATIYDLWRSRDLITSDSLALLAIGTVVSGIVAWFAIAWLLRFISRNTFVIFGYYRILAGVVILLLAAAGMISSHMI